MRIEFRFLTIAALVCFVFALIADATPTTIAGAQWPVWTNAGLVAVTLDWVWGGVSYHNH